MKEVRTKRNYLKVKLIEFYQGIKRSPDYTDNILLFCEQRGGSTWLMELLNHVPNTAVVWEPLHKVLGSADPNLNFGWKQYIPQDIRWEAARKDLQHIMSGRKLNEWGVSRTPIRDYFRAERYMVKFVRGNALLPWLVKQVNLPRKPIFLVRHPISCSLSQMKAFKDDALFEAYFDWASYEFSDYWVQHEPFIKTLRSKLENHVALWCLHNAPALEAADKDKYVTVFYEDLLLNGRHELERIFQGLNLTPPPGIYDKIYEPSKTDFKGDMIPDPSSQIEKWRQKISPSDQKDVQRILEYFKIRAYDAYSPYPVERSIEKSVELREVI